MLFHVTNLYQLKSNVFTPYKPKHTKSHIVATPITYINILHLYMVISITQILHNILERRSRRGTVVPLALRKLKLILRYCVDHSDFKITPASQRRESSCTPVITVYCLLHISIFVIVSSLSAGDIQLRSACYVIGTVAWDRY